MVKFQVSKTILSLPSPGTNISLRVPYEHLGFSYNQYQSQKEFCPYQMPTF